MMTQRFSPLVAWVCAALTATACSSPSTPCTTCPNMGGNYDLRFDHGPPSPQGCTGFTPASEGVLNIGQQGAALTATFDGRAFTGTLQDTYQLRLTSQVTGATHEIQTLSGSYVAPSTDGGVGRILGTLEQVSSTATDGGSNICSATAAFTATHP